MNSAKNAEFGMRNSELRSRDNTRQSDTVRRDANDPKSIPDQ